MTLIAFSPAVAAATGDMVWRLQLVPRKADRSGPARHFGAVARRQIRRLKEFGHDWPAASLRSGTAAGANNAMTSERNDPPMGPKPMGTPLEPTSAASAAASSRPADTAKPTDPKATEAKPASAKPADTKPAASSTAASTATPRSEAKPVPPAAPRRGMGFAGVAVVALIVSAVVAAGLIVLAPRWMPMVSSAPASDPRVAELSTRLDQLAARPVGDPAQSEALRAQIAKLQDELARLSKEQDATADALAQVAGEIDDIKPPQGSRRRRGLAAAARQAGAAAGRCRQRARAYPRHARRA